jgi:hypothetical protein
VIFGGNVKRSENGAGQRYSGTREKPGILKDYSAFRSCILTTLLESLGSQYVAHASMYASGRGRLVATADRAPTRGVAS